VRNAKSSFLHSVEYDVFAVHVFEQIKRVFVVATAPNLLLDSHWPFRAEEKEPRRTEVTLRACHEGFRPISAVTSIVVK